MESSVLEPTWLDLTKSERLFLLAMLQDEKATKQSEMGERLKKPSSHVTRYKKRLLLRGVIQEHGRGYVEFCLPGFREYVAGQCELEG